jgi:hypothetical protein
MSIYPIRAQVIFAALIALAGSDCALADSPSVTAVLSNFQVSLGQTVQLQIRVSGSGGAKVPEHITVDGLEIHPTGTSRQFEMHNLTTTSSVIYNYTILPLMAGSFKIPPQTVRIGNNSLRTPELILNVVSSPGGSARPGTSAQTASGKIAFAELLVTKTTAYVGEIIPVEIRLGFDPRVHPKLVEGPEITGQGFTTQKLQKSDEKLESLGGREYHVVTFKTAISAARTGKFEIGPAQASAVVVIPRQRSSSRPRSPLDLFNMDDPFSDPFFSDPFGSFGQQEKVTIKSEPTTLEVKPLPPNAPANFSGAVGNFAMAVEANPKSVQVGDPITVTATISGRGNFDRMNGPMLEDEHGWHKYPPSSKFKQNDDVGISGARNFEIVLSPNEKKSAIPPLTFAYFDPIKENYATARSEPIPIQVQGGTVPAATTPRSATPATAATSAAPASVAAKPSPNPQDILYQLPDRGHLQSFTPLYARPAFWTAQIVPLIGLLGLVGWKIRRAKIDNREARRIAGLQQESAELLRRLRRSELSPQEYFSDASRAVRVKTALAKNVDPNAVDAETAAAAFELDENSREQLRRLFQRSDELRYSGRPNGADTILREDRQQVLELIERLRV